MAESRATRRRAGYLAAAAASAVLLWLINITPGWQYWGFLTEEFSSVLTLLNVSLGVGLLCNALLVVRDPPLLLGLRDALSATFTLVVLAQLFVRFPFDTAGTGLPLRIILGVLMVASFIGLVAGWSRVARALHVNAHLRRGPDA